MSDFIHNNVGAKANVVNVPEVLEPIEKRFLLRLFRAKGYEVKVVCPVGAVRSPTEHEWNSSPESSPVTSPVDELKRKRNDVHTNPGSVNKAKKHKKNKNNKKD